MTTDRRDILKGMAATGVLSLGTQLDARRSQSGAGRDGFDDAAFRAAIDRVVIIVAENRSFNNLFVGFPGLESPLAEVPPERFRQRDRDGRLLDRLPAVWGGMVPEEQHIDGKSYAVREKDLPGLPNAPFSLKGADGVALPRSVITRDLVHAFWHNQRQINGGRNDGFVAWGDSGALVMGYYAQGAAPMELWRVAREYTLCDNFFMGAFGGSFINHQYMIAARPPLYPDADRSPAAGRIAQLIDGWPMELALAGSSALDGPVPPVRSALTPDFYAVNTLGPPFSPAFSRDRARPEYADPASSNTLPPQTHRTIGDALSEQGVDWAWYAGGWGAALGGAGQMKGVPVRPNFQPHHQPFNYYARFAPGTVDRAHHLRDAGIGETADTNWFLADILADRLPAVSFYKPQGDLNMHAGYADVASGDRHIAVVIDALRQSPQWDRTLVILTFDENGGWWDHVAPPKGDRWGPGTRIPTLVVSPHARKAHVDHTIYDTGSIARLLNRRYGLRTLEGLVERERSMVAAGGPPPGDLTAALDFWD